MGTTDRTRLTRKVRSPAPVLAIRYQTVRLGHETEGRDRPLRLGGVPGGVGHLDLDPFDHRLLERLEVGRGLGPVVVPARRIDDHGGGGRLGLGPEGLGEGPDEFPQRRLHLGGGGRGTGDQEEGPYLGAGEAGQVGGGSPDERPASAPAGLGVDGDTGHGQAFEVPPGRPLGDLELLGQLGRRHPAPGLEEEEGSHETVGTHATSIPRKPDRRWPVSTGTMVVSPGRRPGPSAEQENAPMPMNVPDVPDERTGLLAFLAQQRQALRLAAYGLTDEEARKVTTGSSLSVGGLIKHVTSAERNWIDKVLDCDTSDPTDYSAYIAGFQMGPDESLSDLLRRYEEEGARTDAAIASVVDLGRSVSLPKGVPWFPESASVRWVLLHLIEETARHAGHADVIRESLDGATAGSLMAAAEGWEPAPWVTPWTRFGS